MALFNTLKQILTPYANKINLHTEEIEEIQGDVSEVRADLGAYNSVNYLVDSGSITNNGVTFTWSNNVCTFSGTSNSTAIYNFVFSVNEWPDWLIRGETYIVKYSTTDSNVRLRFSFYVNGTLSSFVFVDNDSTITIPTNATGVVIRLNITSGITVSGSCTVGMFDGLSNKELTNLCAPSVGKYVAFGDSIIWGAVWDDDPNTKYYQASEKYRIPYRIAMSTGHYYKYDNKGISGAGYVYNGGVITSTILNYNYSGVDLITVFGGANDKLHIPLGTAESTAADGTICGAIIEIITHLKTSAPKAKIVIIQPCPSGKDSMDNIWDGKCGGGWSLNDFDREVSKICADKHVGYCNWVQSAYCDNWKQNSGGYSAGIGQNYSHPKSESDFALLGDFIAGKINAVSQTYDTLVNDEIDYLKDDLFGDISTLESVINGSNVVPKWNKMMYIDENTGGIKPSTSRDVSVTNAVLIPDGATAVISSFASSIRYATYDESMTLISLYVDAFGYCIAISSDDAKYVRVQYLSVTDSDLASVKIQLVYKDGLAHLSDLTGQTGFSNEYATASGNPIVVSDTSDSPFSALALTDDTNDEVLSICGKNIFNFQHKAKLGMVKNGVTFHFDVNTQVISIDATNPSTATAISANETFDGGCTKLDGHVAYHNFHFRFPVDTPVAISPNYSYDPYYDDKISLLLLWYEGDTLRALPIGHEGTTVVAKANVTYGIRVKVSKGWSGSCTLKPQVEIGGKCTEHKQYVGADISLPVASGSDNLFNLDLVAGRINRFGNGTIFAEYYHPLKSVNIKANMPISDTIICDYDNDKKLNGKEVVYLYKFVGTGEPICISGIPEELYGLIRYQIVNGTDTITIKDHKPYVFTAQASIEYGFRFVVKAGSKFEYTFNPVIATGLAALKLFGSKHPVTTLYTNGGAGISITCEKTTRNEGIDDAVQVAKGINILTAEKIVEPFKRLSGVEPTICFIDDDTTNPTYVERFHDIFADEGVVGNYAVETSNVGNYPDTMPAMLLGYEQEGFGMLYHCYKQNGDADRYWESGNVAYDEDLIRENFYRGLREYKQYGFNSARYWVTPYGVNDEFIRNLAKEADMECLLTCPTATYTSNAIINFGSNVYRYNMPRFIFLSDSDNDYQARMMIDGCVASKGWLIIVTHVNSWPVASVEANTQRLTALIQYAKTAGCKIQNFMTAYQTFKPLLMLNE